MTDVFSNTQIPLRLNTPEDFCIDDSVHLFLQATRRNESPLADLIDEQAADLVDEQPLTRRKFLGLPTTEEEEQRQDDNERPLIYFTAEDGEIVLRPAD